MKLLAKPIKQKVHVGYKVDLEKLYLSGLLMARAYTWEDGELRYWGGRSALYNTGKIVDNCFYIRDVDLRHLDWGTAYYADAVSIPRKCHVSDDPVSLRNLEDTWTKFLLNVAPEVLICDS